MKGGYDICDLAKVLDLRGPVLSCPMPFHSVISDRYKRGEFEIHKAKS
jgi:hypothetical protein